MSCWNFILFFLYINICYGVAKQKAYKVKTVMVLLYSDLHVCPDSYTCYTPGALRKLL